ncbi:MAG: glycosyltransferase family 1 protein, partial [Bacteroidota bacterium]
MRIGYDAKRLFFNRTGLGNYSRTTLQHLAMAFPEQEYILFSPKRPAPGSYPSFQAPPFQVKTASGPKAWWRSFGQTKDWETHGIDLYHGLSNELPFTSEKAKIPTIVTIHDLIFKEYPQTYPWFDRQVYDLKSRRSCQLATKVVAISASTKRDLIRWYEIPAEKIEVIYQPVAEHYYKPLPDGQVEKVRQQYQLPETFLLSVGTIEARKNLGLVIEALGQIPKAQRPPLVVVGKPTSYKKKVVDKIRKHQLDLQVLWFDWLEDYRDLQALYQAATLLVYPSKYEGMGLPVIEAQLSGTTAITSTVSSLPEAGGEHAILVDPENPEELAAQIQVLLSDHDLRIQKAEAGQQDAKLRFDPAKLTEKLHLF